MHIEYNDVVDLSHVLFFGDLYRVHYCTLMIKELRVSVL